MNIFFSNEGTCLCFFSLCKVYSMYFFTDTMAQPISNEILETFDKTVNHNNIKSPLPKKPIIIKIDDDCCAVQQNNFLWVFSATKNVVYTH